MRPSTVFQNKITEKLQQYFSEVKTEWSVTKNATDVFSVPVYGPRVDVAVGPFNIEKGNKIDEIKTVFKNKAPQKLKNYIESNNLSENANPRCVLAIEVVFSGSSKHILGDITNASMMGLYGFVVASNSKFNKLKRIFEYSKVIKQVGKAPKGLFSNVCVISEEMFLELL